MPLEDYKSKRDFKKTPEPFDGNSEPIETLQDKNVKTGNLISDLKPEEKKTGSSTGGARKLSFVVHKHFASRLHFDLRLELDGVLKSWAVPKGPTINPQEKKLAVMVEDHPLEYGDFEGIIPDGNYGAGQVFIWDRGTYHAYETEDFDRSTEIFRESMQKGHLTFILEGKILKGEFALVRLKKASPKDWLLIKKNDEYARNVDITELKAPNENAEGKKKRD